MLAVVPDDDKTFLAQNPDTLRYKETEVVSATVFGNNGGFFTSDEYPELFLPGGVDIKAVPLIVPQAHLGLPGGFEVEVRYIPPYEIKDMGKISFVGGGVKYQVSKLIPMLSALLPISIQGSYQQLKLGDVVTVNSAFVNIHASRGLVVLPVTFYGGIGYESTQLKAKYTYTEPWSGTEVPIDFDINGDNGFRIYCRCPFKNITPRCNARLFSWQISNSPCRCWIFRFNKLLTTLYQTRSFCFGFF